LGKQQVSVERACGSMMLSQPSWERAYKRIAGWELSQAENAGLMPGRGATRRSGRTWHLDVRYHARWLPDCRQPGNNSVPSGLLVIHSESDLRQNQW